MSNIRFDHIKVKDLHEFAERVLGSAQPGQFIPITMQRALAHANNPYAAKDDVALLVAIDADDEVVGFFGILPLLLRRGEELFKVHWFTTWSVSGKVRGQGVGAQLMAEALDLKLDYLIVGSVHARRVCQKYGFWERAPLHYYWLDATGMGHLNPLVWLRRGMRKVVHLLRIKREVPLKTDFIKRVDNWFAPWTKKIIYRVMSGTADSLLAGARYEDVTHLREAPTTPEPRPNVELHRGADAVNWMLHYPWIVDAGQSVTAEMDYYFSDTRPMYRIFGVEITSPEGEYLGFVTFSISRKSADSVFLKMLDYQFSRREDRRYALALALRYGRQHQADTIEIPQEMAQYMQPRWPRKILLHSKTRIYQCMPKANDSPLAQAWDDLAFKLVDGDMAFS